MCPQRAYNVLRRGGTLITQMTHLGPLGRYDRSLIGLRLFNQLVCHGSLRRTPCGFRRRCPVDRLAADAAQGLAAITPDRLHLPRGYPCVVTAGANHWLEPAGEPLHHRTDDGV